MTVSEEQKRKLYQYLDGIFTYRESLAEVYDHIVSAAEHHQGEHSFEDEVKRVIDEDFGGHQRLPYFEKQYKKNAKSQLNSKMRRAFLGNLIRKGWIPLLPTLIALFYIRVNIFPPAVVWGLMAVYFSFSIGHHFYMHYRARRVYGACKKSFKTAILGNILNMPVSFNPMLILSLKGTQYIMDHATDFSALSTGKIIYMIFLMLLLYVFYPVFMYTYFQLFKKEYSLKPVIK